MRRINGFLVAMAMLPVFLVGFLAVIFGSIPAVRDFVAPQPFDPAMLSDAPAIEGLDTQTAVLLAAQIWPDETAVPVEATSYLGVPAMAAETARGKVFLIRTSGYYAVVRPHSERIYAPNGSEVHARLDWSAMIRGVYETSGLNRAAAGKLADVTGIALLFFGLGGLVLWWMPRGARLLRASGGEFGT